MKLQKRMPVSAMLDPKIVIPAIGSSFAKLDPRLMVKNPVMFVVEIVAALTTVIFLKNVVSGGESLAFTFQIILWLWFTVLFANFAEAVAEGRGKAQAESLRKTRTESQAKLLTGSDNAYRLVSGTSLKVGDIVLVEAGDNIPSDGEVIEGVASVNEAAITGESAPVIRESGGDRSAVTGGTQVLSDWIKVRISAAQGSTFLDRMIKLVDGDDPELRGLCRRHGFGRYPRGALRHADPDNDRRAAFGHRHRRHGPPGALQCARHVGAGRRGGRRCRYAAPRQDRHHYARQSPGDRVQTH